MLLVVLVLALFSCASTMMTVASSAYNTSIIFNYNPTEHLANTCMINSVSVWVNGTKIIDNNVALATITLTCAGYTIFSQSMPLNYPFNINIVPYENPCLLQAIYDMNGQIETLSTELPFEVVPLALHGQVYDIQGTDLLTLFQVTPD